jgi:hypothetical protein
MHRAVLCEVENFYTTVTKMVIFELPKFQDLGAHVSHVTRVQ